MAIVIFLQSILSPLHNISCGVDWSKLSLKGDCEIIISSPVWGSLELDLNSLIGVVT